MTTGHHNLKHETEDQPIPHSDDDPVVFIPDSDIRAIEHVIRNMEQAQEGLRNIKKENNNSHQQTV